jgi:8-oxo-dGTP pyrophosphatase MutT (NUDIX family)
VHRKLELHHWLTTYAPEDEGERAFRARMLALLDEQPEPFSRSSFIPGHFTASAFVLDPDQQAVLLILHAKLHRWLQPGGHVNTEDVDILAAARREVSEEVGLNDLPLAVEGIFDLDIHPIPALKAEPAHEHFDVRFLFRAPSHAYAAGSDAKAARWVKLGDVNELESDRSVLRAIQKLMR